MNGGITRVLIADADPIDAAGLRKILSKERDIEVVAVHTAVEGLLEAAKSTTPDLLLFDPTMAGDAAAALVAAVSPHTKILITARLERVEVA